MFSAMASAYFGTKSSFVTKRLSPYEPASYGRRPPAATTAGQLGRSVVGRLMIPERKVGAGALAVSPYLFGAGAGVQRFRSSHPASGCLASLEGRLLTANLGGCQLAGWSLLRAGAPEFRPRAIASAQKRLS